MRIEHLTRPIFETCQIPAAFMDEYLPLLSGDAVRLYLLLVRAVGRGETPDRQGLAARLRLEGDRLPGLFDELVKQGLIELEGEDTCRLVDLQSKALERSYRRRTSPSPSERAAQTVDSAREALVNSISNTYFNGMLSANWYNLINELLDECGFDLPVVYSLFSICAARNKLNRSYVRSVGADWHRKQVVTQADLNRLNRNWEERQQIANRVGRLMNRHMTRPDRDEVNSWVERYGYGIDMIEAAIERTKGIESPNLNYVAKVLSSWHKAGLQTPAEVAAHEEKRRREIASSQGRKAYVARSARGDNVGNFEQRHYTEKELDGLVAGPDNWEALDRMLELNREAKRKRELAEGEDQA